MQGHFKQNNTGDGFFVAHSVLGYAGKLVT